MGNSPGQDVTMVKTLTATSSPTNSERRRLQVVEYPSMVHGKPSPIDLPFPLPQLGTFLDTMN